MDNPEKLAILGTKDTRRRQTKQKRQHIMCGEHYTIYKISRERNRKLRNEFLCNYILCEMSNQFKPNEMVINHLDLV